MAYLRTLPVCNESGCTRWATHSLYDEGAIRLGDYCSLHALAALHRWVKRHDRVRSHSTEKERGKKS
jgi:hypothetical protein